MEYKSPEREEQCCLMCGNEIRYGRRGRTFCSEECRNRYHNTMAGEIRSYRNRVITALSVNYRILEALILQEKGSAPLTELEAAGFRPGFITSCRKDRYGHTECSCFDIHYCQTAAKVFQIRRVSLRLLGFHGSR
ncbi:MAG: hypothetical protein IJU63_05010 [Bacteroidales bacterium]|nr:hypothetical protein [Bacteroidales bacterium]